jgi:hypothetical protein
MASEVWVGLSERELKLLQRLLAPRVVRGDVEANALSHKLDRARIDSESAYACIFAEGGKAVTLSKQEYGIIESALEWRSSDLYEEVACSVEPEYTELRAEAALAEKIWGQM